jgi:CRISP-associated protein Cas1
LKSELDSVRGAEGMASQQYFSMFSLLLKQQREAFAFGIRSRRPPRDRINCLLSFLYALVRHDCVAALTSIADALHSGAHSRAHGVIAPVDLTEPLVL